ncbi:MAG: glycosyltransferase [Barnesiella sp.]|nr:glycosyltransferase [Barnesiella sp.]
MDYLQINPEQLSPLTIELISLAAFAALVLLFTLMPSLNLIIKSSKIKRKRKTEQNFDYEGISIIVISGFHTDCLRACVENIYSQNTQQPVEIIIVNTNGEEHTEYAIKMLQADYPEIKHTFVPIQSRHLSKRKLAITLGIKAASYPIVLFTTANIIPKTEGWLESVMSRFKNGADIVIGTTVLRNVKTGETVGKIRAFDSVKALLRRIPAALKGSPVGADSANLAYRKKLFFNNKGFSDTLNLNYGDDDIFISEIAKNHRVAVDISKDSVLTLHEENPKQVYDIERKSRLFTQSKLRRTPFITSGIQDILWWVWLLSSIAAIFFGLPSLLPAVCIFVIAIFLIVPLSIRWRKVTKILSLPYHTLILPFLSLINPFIYLRYKINFGRKPRNYTWQN